ncbi:MAG: hypothetical protein ACOZBH_01670 [Patescibacteria group bacterium]
MIAMAIIPKRAREWIALNPIVTGFIQSFIDQHAQLGIMDRFLLIMLLGNILIDDSFVACREDHPKVRALNEGDIDFDAAVDHLLEQFPYLATAVSDLHRQTTGSQQENLTVLFKLLIFHSHADKI